MMTDEKRREIAERHCFYTKTLTDAAWGTRREVQVAAIDDVVAALRELEAAVRQECAEMAKEIAAICEQEGEEDCAETGRAIAAAILGKEPR